MDVRDSYDSAADAYAGHLATELVHKPLDRHVLNRFAEEARGRGLVADLGCGPGHVARYLQEQGVAVVGIDLSPGMVRVAAGLHPGVVIEALRRERLAVIEHVEREPYEGVEYPSRRCYLLARAKGL
ncbi:MAG TPA: methyltransferase domain-containing protein [Thermoanaerobaculia bacterium]